MKQLLRYLLPIRLNYLLKTADRYEKLDLTHGIIKKEIILLSNILGFYLGDLQ